MTPRDTWHRALWLWGPPAIYALAIFVLSSLSSPPSLPQQLTDKHGHALAYAGLALVLVRALSGGRWSGLTMAAGLQAAVTAIAYGASDEWHQSLVPGRHADPWDLAADGVGVVLALGVVGAGAWWRRRGARTDGTIERAAERVGQMP